MSYDEFLRSKAAVAIPTGIEDVPPLGDYLFPFQNDVTRWALRRGRAALFLDTGLGKTISQSEWASQVQAYAEAEGIGDKVLILAPLAVADQTVKEAERFGIEVHYCRTQSAVRPGVTIANYDMLHEFDPSAFAGVVLDECFSPDTPVDVCLEDGRMQPIPIASIRPGISILNASGIDVVADVHRREVPYAVRVTIAGRSFVCSPNHPIFTQRGWVGAQDLEPGDSALETRAAVRMVREDVRSENPRRKILRSILLSEMAYEAAGGARQDSQSGSGGEAWPIQIGMVQVREPGGDEGTGSHRGAQSDETAGSEGEDLPPVERNRARTFRAWGQRAWFDGASADSSGCTRTELEGGVCLVTGTTDSRLSDTLQARLGAARSASVYRGGWFLARGHEAPGAGRKEGCETGFARVDGIEILEPGHPELERMRSSDGKLYFYDLGGTQHPSFSVNGILVHNSSILKNLDGKTRTAIIEAFSKTPFRLACTATPAPNDLTEIGNHAQFLGIMSMQEMLATYFVHDGGETQKWRLKGHAEAEFWKWVCTWAALVKRPSDLGYSDDGYILPDLRTHEHVIRATQEQARKQGRLFAEPAASLAEQREARRATMSERVSIAHDLIMAEPDESWLVWCELNKESEELTASIPSAVEVKGSDSFDRKRQVLTGFAEGKIKYLVTKPKIAGLGMNFQRCARMVDIGASHSFEATYQKIRRCWRFGQKRPVDYHAIYSELEANVVANQRRKMADAERLAESMRKYTIAHVRENVRGAMREEDTYNPAQPMMLPSWLRSEVQP